MSFRHVVQYARRELVGNRYLVNLSNDKVVCNEGAVQGEEDYYVKVGGILDMKSANISLFFRELKDQNDWYGYWIILVDSTRLHIVYNIYAIAKRYKKSLVLSPVISIIPRYRYINGKSNVIVGMRVDSTRGSDREWCDRAVNGFHEVYKSHKYESDCKRNRRYVGFYVGVNTTLIMIDTFDSVNFGESGKNHTRTLFQEGAFVYFETTQVLFRYHANTEMRAGEMVVRNIPEAEVMNDEHQKYSKDLHFNRPNNCNNYVLFLQSTPALHPWCVIVCKSQTAHRKSIIITPPTGAAFEDCMEWSAGINEVKQRQLIEPWRKYIQLKSDKPVNEFVDKIDDRDVYPNFRAVPQSAQRMYTEMGKYCSPKAPVPQSGASGSQPQPHGVKSVAPSSLRPQSKSRAHNVIPSSTKTRVETKGSSGPTSSGSKPHGSTPSGPPKSGSKSKSTAKKRSHSKSRSKSPAKRSRSRSPSKERSSRSRSRSSSPQPRGRGGGRGGSRGGSRGGRRGRTRGGSRGRGRGRGR